jgi:hypothetical protein
MIVTNAATGTDPRQEDMSTHETGHGRRSRHLMINDTKSPRCSKTTPNSNMLTKHGMLLLLIKIMEVLTRHVSSGFTMPHVPSRKRNVIHPCLDCRTQDQTNHIQTYHEAHDMIRGRERMHPEAGTTSAWTTAGTTTLYQMRLRSFSRRENRIHVVSYQLLFVLFMFLVKDVLASFVSLPENKNAPSPRWAPAFCGDQLVLSDNNRRVVKKYAGYTNGIQSAQPCTRFSVKIIHGHEIVVGFAPRLGFQKNFYNMDACGWFIHIADGSLWSQDTPDAKNGRAYGTPIPVGSIVTAIYDLQQHTIEFHVNGQSLGIAFRNVSDEELYAAADLWGKQTAIRLMDKDSM